MGDFFKKIASDMFQNRTRKPRGGLEDDQYSEEEENKGVVRNSVDNLIKSYGKKLFKKALSSKFAIICGAVLGKIIIVVICVVIILIPLSYSMMIYEGVINVFNDVTLKASTNVKNTWDSLFESKTNYDRLDKVADNYENFLLERFKFLNRKLLDEKLTDGEADDAKMVAIEWVYSKIYNDFFKAATLWDVMKNPFGDLNDLTKTPILKPLPETATEIYVPVNGSNVEESRKNNFGDSINLYDVEAFDYVAGTLFDLMQLDLSLARQEIINDRQKEIDEKTEAALLESARLQAENILLDWSNKLYYLITETKGSQKDLKDLGLDHTIVKKYGKSMGVHNLHTFMKDCYSYTSSEQYKWFVSELDKLDKDGCEKGYSLKKISAALIKNSSDIEKLSSVADEIENVYVSYIKSLGSTVEQQQKLKDQTQKRVENKPFKTIYDTNFSKYDGNKDSAKTEIVKDVTEDELNEKMKNMIKDLNLVRTQQAAYTYRDYLTELEDVTTIKYYSFNMEHEIFDMLYKIPKYDSSFFSRYGSSGEDVETIMNSDSLYDGFEKLIPNSEYVSQNITGIKENIYIDANKVNPIVVGVDSSTGTDYLSSSKSIFVSELYNIVNDAIKQIGDVKSEFDEARKSDLEKENDEYYDRINKLISSEIQKLNAYKRKIKSLEDVTLQNDPLGVLIEAPISTIGKNDVFVSRDKDYIVNKNELKVKKFKNTQEEAVKKTAVACFGDILARLKNLNNANKEGMVLDIGDLTLGSNTVAGSPGYQAYSNALKFLDIAQEVVAENDNLIDPYYLIAMIATETSGIPREFNPSASAVGIMQIENKHWDKKFTLPSGKTVTADPAKIAVDHKLAIELGMYFALENASEFEGNLFMSIVGYNMGKFGMERIVFLTLAGQGKVDKSVWLGPKTTAVEGIKNPIERRRVLQLMSDYMKSGDLDWLNYRAEYQQEKWFGNDVGTLNHLEKVLSFYNTAQGMPWYRPSKDSGKIVMGSVTGSGDISIGENENGEKIYHKNKRLYLWKEYYTDKDIFKEADNWFSKNAEKEEEKSKLVSATIIDTINEIDYKYENLFNQIDITSAEFKSILAATLNTGVVAETRGGLGRNVVCQPGFKVTPTTLADTKNLINAVAKEYIDIYTQLNGKDKDFAVYIYLANNRELAKAEISNEKGSFVDFVKNKYKDDLESFTSPDSNLLKVAQVLTGDLNVNAKDFYNLVDNVSTGSSSDSNNLKNPIDEYYQQWLDAKYTMHEMYNTMIDGVNEELIKQGKTPRPLLPTYEEAVLNNNNKVTESDIEGTITINGPNGEMYSVQIKRKLLDKQGIGPLNSPEYIVIHDTGKTGSDGEALKYFNTMNSDSANESMHYIVGSSDIYHTIKNNFAANHINDSSTSTGGTMPQVTNSNSLGVQFEANTTRNRDKVFWHTVAITKYLMEENRITNYDNVILHNDVTGVKDSNVMLKDDKAEWKKFKDALKNSTITFSANTGNLSGSVYKLVETARSLLGQPYVYGAAGEVVTDELISKLKSNASFAANGEYEKTPRKFFDGTYRGFDCSSFVQYVYAQNGISIDRTTYAQMKQGTEVFKDGESIVESRLQPGDLLFSDGHVVMWIGNGEYIHASQPGDVVKIGRGIPSGIIKVKRIIENNGSFEFYSQHDSRWASFPYCGDSVSMSGCGPTSTAMVLSGLKYTNSTKIDTNNDGKITPDELAQFSTKNGTYINTAGTTTEFYNRVGAELNIPVKLIWADRDSDVLINELKSYLKSGKAIVASYNAGHWIPYGGHLIALVGVDNNNKIIVHDPNLNSYEDTRGGRFNGPNPDSHIVGPGTGAYFFVVFG